MRLKFLLAITTLLGIGAATRIATLPPYDPVSDVNKVATISNTGNVIWSTLAADGAALGATGSVVNNDLVSWAGTGGRQLADSGIPLSNVVLVSRQLIAGTGITVTPQQQLTSDVTIRMSTLDNQNLTVGGTLAASGSFTAAAGEVISSGNLQFSGTAQSIVVPTGTSSALKINDSGGSLYMTVDTNLSTFFYGNSNIQLSGGTINLTNQSFINNSNNTNNITLPTGQTFALKIRDAASNNRMIFNTTTGGVSVSGTNTNDSASSGFYGEIQTAQTLRSAAISLTSATPSNMFIAPLSINAGDWQCSAFIGFIPAASTTVTDMQLAISKTSATLPGNNTLGVPTSGEVRTRVTSTGTIITGGEYVLTTPPIRISIASTTSIFLVAQATFVVSTMTSYGSITCIRAR